MPIEIKELHVRVAVSPAPAASPAGGAAPAASAGGGAGGDKDAIIAECIEQVLEILRTRRER